MDEIKGDENQSKQEHINKKGTVGMFSYHGRIRLDIFAVFGPGNGLTLTLS